MTKNIKSYQELNSELDAVIEALNSGEQDIDESIKLYQKGTQLVKQLEQYLTQAQNKVIKIKNSGKNSK